LGNGGFLHSLYAVAPRASRERGSLGAMSNPLIITRDETLLDELLRLGAAAGTVPEVVPDAGAALSSWGAASVVMVGADVATDLVRLGPPRRAGVHLIGWGSLADEVFRLAVALGAENVAELPRSEAWVLEMLADTGDGAPGECVTIGVVGGSGGSGSTTFACCLALAAARRFPTCLIDADPQGPGVDRVLGFDRMDGVRWDSLQQTTGRISARSLREALPRRDNLGVLTWPPGAQVSLQPFAVREAMSAAARGHEVVVLDVPRAGGPLSEELMARCTTVVLVVRATVPGLTSAARVAAVASRSGSVGLLVRGSGADPGRVARVVGAPVLATMADQRGLDEAVDLGLGPLRSRRSVLGRAADRVLSEVLGRRTAERAA
jgi:secretion/DNA translocation related CpaE-like protein